MPDSELESHLLWLEGRPCGRPSPRLLDIEFLHLPDFVRNRPWRHTGWRGADLPDNYPFDTTPEGLFDAAYPGKRIDDIRIHESRPGGTYRDTDFGGAYAHPWEPTPSDQLESGWWIPSEGTGSIGQYFERMRGSINLSARDKTFLREWMDDFLAHGSIADSEAIGNRIQSYREAIDTLGELLRNDNADKDPFRAAFLRMKAEAIEKRISQQLRYRLKPGSRANGSTVRDWYSPVDGGTQSPLEEAIVYRNPRRSGDPDVSGHRVCWMPSAGPWFDPDAYDAAFRKAGLSAPDFYILNDGWTVMIQKAVALWEPEYVHRFELKPGIPFHVGTGYVHFASPTRHPAPGSITSPATHPYSTPRSRTTTSSSNSSCDAASTSPISSTHAKAWASAAAAQASRPSSTSSATPPSTACSPIATSSSAAAST